MPQVVSARYAHAFVDLLLAPQAQSNVEAELRSLGELDQAVTELPDFRNVLLSPAVPVARKRSLMRKLAPEFRLSPLALRFLLVLIDHGRIPLLGDVLQAVRQDLDARLGIVRAAVTSAITLSPEQQQTVQNDLSRVTGKQVRAAFQVDPEILGGLVARIGSTIYDGSVRGQLQALRHQLAGQNR